MNHFQALFHFDPNNAWCVGVERERFIFDGSPVPVSRAIEVLNALPQDNRFGPELSACQLEDRVGPVDINQLDHVLRANDQEIHHACIATGLRTQFLEVAPEGMPIDVHQDSSGRYARIAANIGPERLLAACRVAGTHVHVGMPSADVALRVYNHVAPHWQKLVKMGDHSQGERLRLYRVVAGKAVPQGYSDWEAFEQHAELAGFVNNPRDCWDLIRISAHGTIEFRVFGVTPHLSEILSWAHTCVDLCLQVR